MKFIKLQTSAISGEISLMAQRKKGMDSKYMGGSNKNEEKTFIVTVKSRKNQTWQGTVNWVEEKRIQPFRSALELIRLMDSAIGEEEEE